MESFRMLVRAYCICCITAGIVQEFLSSGESKKVMQGLTGLYMIATLLSCGKDLTFPVPWSNPEPSVAPASCYTYNDMVLQQAKEEMEHSCTEMMRKEDLNVQAKFELEVTPQGEVSVQQIHLLGEQSAKAESIAKLFAAKEILWEPGEAYG